MIKIMFVCHGNICRSPMAEIVCRELLAQRGLSSHVTLSSSATSTEEIWNGIGNPIYPPAREELLRHGHAIDDAKRAVQLQKSDYEAYDLFIGMDQNNIRNMRRIFGGDPKNKITLLTDYTGRGGEVADPWYSRRFDITYLDILDGCHGLMSYLEKMKP